MRRSMLFIPGNSANLLMNADILGADSIILDLEDAVSPAEKDSARILVRNVLKSLPYSGVEIIIRVNSVDTDFFEKDLAEVINKKTNVIMLPKSSCAKDIHYASRKIAKYEKKAGLEKGSIKIMPLIETAKGVENAYEIAKSDARVVAVFLGAEDLTADLRCKRTKEGNEIFYSRSRLVVAARAAGVDVYDTPFTDVDDLEGIEKDARFAKGLGFTGKASISPRHVEIINKVFSPSKAEIEYAHDVMNAIEEGKKQGKGVVALRGKMIDAPVVARAQQIIQMEKAIYGESNE